MSPRVWIVTEFYHPDENATGYLMTNLAQGMSRRHQVNVVCGKSSAKSVAPGRSTGNDKAPTVRRVPSTRFNKDRLFLRLINIFTLSISIFFSLLYYLRQNDIIIVVTNPPTLPYLAKVAAYVKKSLCIVVVYDVYPEVLVATGLVGPSSVLVRTLHYLTHRLLESVQAVVVLGRDMKNLMTDKYPGALNHLEVIPNWVDTEEIRPTGRLHIPLMSTLGLLNKFVVGYVGNMGRTHDIETLADVAVVLANDPDVHFLFIGDGAKKEWLENFIAKHRLVNVSVLPFQDRTRQSEVHNACDLAVIAFLPGMAGLSVPSRLYNMMAAGKPILAVADESSELASVVKEEQIGWVVSRPSVEEISEYIVGAKRDPSTVREMGQRARIAAEKEYSFEKALQTYENLISQFCAVQHEEDSPHRRHTA